MEDGQIIDLYWERDEKALGATREKYGAYLTKIAFNVLNSKEDSEEAVNDTYLKAWNGIPPARPKVLKSFLSCLARRTSIDLLRKKTAARRGSRYEVSLSELEECVPSEGPNAEKAMETAFLAETIQAYLDTLSKEKRQIFVCRYYFMDSVSEIASYLGHREEKIRTVLCRLRQGLKKHLEQEGYSV